MSEKPKLNNISPELQELAEPIKKKLLIEQIERDPVYFQKLCEMDKASLVEEVERLKEATVHYQNATGDELDWQWSKAQKKAASQNLEKLRLAEAVLGKNEEISSFIKAAKAQLN